MLYIIQADNDLYKIGISKDPSKRLKQLQTGNGQKLRLYKTYQVINERVLEKKIHAMLWENKSLLGKSEWFKLCPLTLEWLENWLNG